MSSRISQSIFDDNDSSSSMISSRKGWVTVAGGFLIHLVLGTLYCWANITSAVTSHLRRYEPSVDYNDTIMVYAAELVAQGCTMLVGGLISQRIGPRRTCAIGAALLFLGTLLSAYARSLAALLLCQGVLFGAGIGLSYTAPIAAAMHWLPDRKGLVTGIIVAGFGLGAFVFGFVATSLVNPQHESVNNEGPDENYFSASSLVVERVPNMYVKLSVCYLVILVMGCSFVWDPPLARAGRSAPLSASNSSMESYQSAPTADIEMMQNPMSLHAGEDEEVEIAFASRSLPLTPSSHGESDALHVTINDENTMIIKGAAEEHGDGESFKRELTSLEILKEPLAWHLASCLICTTIGGMYVAGTFKTFAQTVFKDERFLASVSATSSIFNSLGRVFWGFLADRYGSLSTLLGLSLIFSVILISYPTVVHVDSAFFVLWTFGIFFFEGGNFVLYFPMVVDHFGDRSAASNYGLIFSAYSFFVMLNILIASRSGLSFPVLCVIMGIITFTGFMNLVLLRSHSRSHFSKCTKRTA